ncbi:hypothetical protein HME9304_01855 [Flagellimonas maritima]|uniref:DUF6265 domain-containing protein n=1 Tax=Flagellimonas maritima TaxID=1383885 RepID=A0A2Z4LT38_9FLAO|nr:DUF6265 family protein [Allomuricauda aurantiaca]AWX44850.1 hypothetical protein HME9304_01855 [Allomuricauda aurantiaca]
MRQFFMLCFFVTISSKGQNTLSFKKGDISPKASLTEVAWMEGHWKGEAFGGIAEDLWSPPSGGSMMFVFRHILEGKVNFYEIGHFREIDGTLVFELKHFNADLKGWEEKNVVQTFKLIKVDGNRVYFDGFTFEKVTPNEVNIYAIIGGKEQNPKEILFNYKKVLR